jgi:hypothetical protein
LLSEAKTELVVVGRERYLAVLAHDEYKSLHFFFVDLGYLFAVEFAFLQRVLASDGEHFNRWPALKRKLEHKSI